MKYLLIAAILFIGCHNQDKWKAELKAYNAFQRIEQTIYIPYYKREELMRILREEFEHGK